MIGGLDTHELVKNIKASGFTDAQAEAVTRAVRLAQDLDLSNVATKTNVAELELGLIKWVIGVGVSAALAVGAMILTATQVVLRAASSRVKGKERGFPDRIVPVGPKAAAILKKRTLTNLYNERPAWLGNAHRELDAAVAAAYGWPAEIGEEEALARLLALNLERAGRADEPGR